MSPTPCAGRVKLSRAGNRPTRLQTLKNALKTVEVKVTLPVAGETSATLPVSENSYSEPYFSVLGLVLPKGR